MSPATRLRRPPPRVAAGLRGCRTCAAATATVLAAACLPPETAAERARLAARPRAVRVHAAGTVRPAEGTLVRLTADSVVWTREPGTAPQARALRDVARVEVAEPLTQRAALRRGLLRGALVGGAIGGVVIATNPDAVGAGVGIALGSAWLSGVFAGQQTESPRPPVRWRVVHPASAAGAVGR